jgi:hypothetical protein
MQERHLNTTLKSLSPQSQCQLSRKQRKTNASEDVGKRSPSIILLEMWTSVMHTLLLGISSATVIGNVNKNQIYTAIGNVNECHCYGNNMEAYQIKKNKRKNLKRVLHNYPAVLLLAWIQRIAYQHTGATASNNIYHSTIHY